VSAPRPKPSCQSVRTWLQGRLGRQCLGPFTGTTGRAFSAYVHLLEAWCASRSPAVVEALRATVAVLQPGEWHLAAWAIVAVGDWGFVAELWPRIKPPDAPSWIGRGDVPPKPGSECWGDLVEARTRAVSP
jgi:hypothetical protein